MYHNKYALSQTLILMTPSPLSKTFILLIPPLRGKMSCLMIICVSDSDLFYFFFPFYCFVFNLTCIYREKTNLKCH